MIAGMKLYMLYGFMGHLRFSSGMKTQNCLEAGHSQMFMSITKILTFTTFTS